MKMIDVQENPQQEVHHDQAAVQDHDDINSIVTYAEESGSSNIPICIEEAMETIDLPMDEAPNNEIGIIISYAILGFSFSFSIEN
jgi:hypothetical protein